MAESSHKLSAAALFTKWTSGVLQVKAGCYRGNGQENRQQKSEAEAEEEGRRANYSERKTKVKSPGCDLEDLKNSQTWKHKHRLLAENTLAQLFPIKNTYIHIYHTQIHTPPLSHTHALTHTYTNTSSKI